MSSRQAEYLNAMGIQRWQLRAGEGMVEQGKSLEKSSPSAEVAIANETIVDNEREWWSLSDEVAACRQCELHQGRTQTVFGTGNQNAGWLIIGEAPGADEEQQGEPFVGHAGQLLTQMILALGYEREQVYIANILKCRPPNDRDPLSDEVSCCEAYLKRQIALIQPKIIVAVGRVAAQNMLKTDAEISAIRGQTHHYGEFKIPLVVTYHPAYLLHSPIEKSKAWQDLLLAKQIFQQA